MPILVSAAIFLCAQNTRSLSPMAAFCCRLALCFQLFYYAIVKNLYLQRAKNRYTSGRKIFDEGCGPRRRTAWSRHPGPVPLRLAWKVWRSSADVEADSRKRGQLSSRMILQFPNPKIYIYAITAMTLNILPVYRSTGAVGLTLPSSWR